MPIDTYMYISSLPVSWVLAKIRLDLHVLGCCDELKSFLAAVFSIFTAFLCVVYMCAGHIDRTHYFYF